MRHFAQGLGINPSAEFAAWKDDCEAHDRRYVDWPAAWRTRCRNAVKFGGAALRNGNGKSSGGSSLPPRLEEVFGGVK
jgi:hypothetical protein